MKFFVVSACLLVGASAIHHEVIKAKWSSYKAQHAKDYHASEESVRLNNFLQSTLEIELHNARFHRGEVGYELGHNDLSDMSQAEVKAKFLGKKSMSVAGRNFTDVPRMTMPSLPSRVDWREQNIVTPAKDQSACGSCYSFGTMGVIESAIAQKTGKLLDLSEQQVVDCSYHIEGDMNGGCDGGHEVVVMEYVSKYGVHEESKYPYTSGRRQRHGTCQQKRGPHGTRLQFRRVEPEDEVALAEAVATHGTMVISISGENRDFQLYTKGIYDNPDCTKDVDHVISVIGYGSEGGRDYWLVKNSWGTRWGQGGVGKVLRGVNQCGIVSDNSWSIYF